MEPLLRALQKKGLINREETAKIRQSNETKKAEFLVDNIPNRRNWAYQFYKILKNDENQSNVKVRKLFESFILDFKHPGIPVEEIGFVRYPIRNNPCGICLIINMQTFEDKILGERKGSGLDVSNLHYTFDKMNFIVRKCEDLSKSELIKELETYSAMDHENYDVFFCIIMSHGNKENEIYTTDLEAININEIQNYFTPNNCPSLCGKPKIFIIQACRGEAKDLGQPEIPDPQAGMSTPPNTPNTLASHTTTISQDAPLESKKNVFETSKTAMEKVATHVDFYIAHATVHGYLSYRNPEKGSFFINNFCTVLQAEKYNRHFSDIMIEVRRRVLMIDISDILQCSESTDTLRKQLFLF